MELVNNIECSPSLIENKRKKIADFLDDMLKSCGGSISNYDMELRTMRKYFLIENGKLNPTFDICSKSKDFNSEIVIADNDVFIPCGIALGFLKTPLISPGVYEKIENQDILYFPSQTAFTYTAPGAVPQYKALENMYYSQLTFTSGSDSLLTKFDARYLKKVPQLKTEGQYYYQDTEYADMTESPIIVGSDGVEVSFAGASGDTASAGGDPATEKTYIVLLLTGYNVFKLAEPWSAVNCPAKTI